MGTGGSFSGGKARPGRDADHSPPSSAKVANEKELYLLSPQAPPWRVAGHLYIFIFVVAYMFQPFICHPQGLFPYLWKPLQLIKVDGWFALKWLDVAVEWFALLLCIQDVQSSNLGTETGCPDCSFYFTQSLQANFVIVPKLGHDHFLPYPFQFIIH
jgi:hypothetical protein